MAFVSCLSAKRSCFALRLEDVALNRVSNKKVTNRSAEGLGHLFEFSFSTPFPSLVLPLKRLFLNTTMLDGVKTHFLLLLQVGIMFEKELHHEYGCCVVEGIAAYSGDVQPDTIYEQRLNLLLYKSTIPYCCCDGT